MRTLETVFRNKKPVIGMVHLRPLPGSAMYDPVVMGMNQILKTAAEEAKMLEAAGVDGVQVENMWDIPYFQSDRISSDTIASLAVGVYEVGRHVSIPVGAECHMNGADIALSCAVAAGAKWIRVFEWCNAFISQAGYIEAIGARVAKKRHDLRAEHILALCDVNVKHGSHYIIHDRSVEEQAMDIEAQGGDAVIVTGFDTGTPPTAERVLACKKAVSLPVFLGSGVNNQNISTLLAAADGAIVGSWFKEDGNWKKGVSYERTRDFMREVEKLRGER